MKDYLRILDSQISRKQEENFVERAYRNGYLDALAHIRIALNSLIEQRENESEAQDE